MQTKNSAHDTAPSYALCQMASGAQVCYSEVILNRLHNLKFLHFGCFSKKNRNGGFLQHLSLVKKLCQKTMFYVFPLFHCLSCGEEFALWSLAICTKLVDFYLLVKISCVWKQGNRLVRQLFASNIIFYALKTALAREQSCTGGKNRMKIVVASCFIS